MSNGGVRAEFAAPHANGAYVPEVFIQHVRDHAKNVRKSAVRDFVFEVADDDVAEVAHDSDCLSPIRRSRAGWSAAMIMRPMNVLLISSSSDCRGQRGSGKASWLRALSTL